MKLLTTSNPKTMLGESMGYRTAILHFAPSKLSGYNVCPSASAGCIKGCLNKAGHGSMERGNVPIARKRRTKYYFENNKSFLRRLYVEIEDEQLRAEKLGVNLAVRLNGTSDLPDLSIEAAREFPGVQFYDYTKNFDTLLRKDLPENYHLTFSRSEGNWLDCLEARKLGYNVSVLFEKIPETYFGIPVVNGDLHDLRFLDPENSIIGLTPKGPAKKDKTGFVVR